MISCAEAVRRLWDYLEQDLDAETRAGVETHLAFCRRCCGEVEFAAALRELLGSTASPDLPADVEDRLAGFLAGLDEEGP